jgi:hypothetical protein
METPQSGIKQSAHDAVLRFLCSPTRLEAVSNAEERIESRRKKWRVQNMTPVRHARKNDSDRASNMSPVRLNNRREQQVIRSSTAVVPIAQTWDHSHRCPHCGYVCSCYYMYYFKFT